MNQINKILCNFIKIYRVFLISSRIPKINPTKSLTYFLLRWHRLGISIKGDSVSLIVDCQIKGTLPLRRHPGSTFNLAGALVVGTQITPDQYYEVNL